MVPPDFVADSDEEVDSTDLEDDMTAVGVGSEKRTDFGKVCFPS